MTGVLTADQMRALEREAIESGRVTGLELVERAGAGAVEAILTEWPELAEGDRRAVVLCGPGNNGGDGFVVARLLKERGWAVEVFLYGDPNKLPPDARVNYERWIEADSVAPLEQAHGRVWLPHPSAGYPVRVDALFGIGLSRPAPQEVVSVLATSLNCLTVALDVPSVLQSDTGRSLPSWPSAFAPSRLTVAFGALKPGHLIGEGPDLCGRVRVVDLDLGAFGEGSSLVEAPDVGKGGGHKYDHGHALILSGPMGRGGAARLAARAALRVGAGAVTVGCPPSGLMENAVRLPDAVMVRTLRDAGALREALADRRINALCLGPGLGTGEREAALLGAALDPGRKGPLTLVLDADALTILASNEALRAKLRPGHVLTPHLGEFARLAPDLAERLREDATYSKVDATRDAAARLNATVLLKGPDTVIARPDGRAAIHAAVRERAAPWLATAGAGDVLAGMIAGLMARGLDGFDAACAAAWLHVEAAQAFGPGLTADDLPEALPGVLASLEAEEG